MQVMKNQVGTCTYDLQIDVEAEAVTRAFGRAFREFNAFTNVPGFRAGKAPRTVLEKYVNQERLRERVMELLAAPAYREAIKQEGITPYADPEVEFGELEEGKAWRFKATVPTPPEVTLGDYSDLAVERPIFSVGDADVDQTVDSIRKDHSELKQTSGRGVQAGDVLVAEMTIQFEDAPEPPQPRRTLVRVGDNIPGFDDAIMGQEAGEERTFSLTFPEDYQDADRAGKLATFTVNVIQVNERVLPDVTDEWVKAVANLDTVEDWRTAIRAELESSMTNLADQVAESRIVEQLVKRSTLAFPPFMVEEEVVEQLAQLQEELQRGRIDYQRYLELSGLTEEQHHGQLAKKAEERIRTRLVLREFVRAEQITVSDTELEGELAALAVAAEGGTPRITPRDAEERVNRAANRVIQQKLRDVLFTKATITDVAQQKPAES